MNEQRFLSLDLSYGSRVDSFMYEFLLDNGMSRKEYHWLLDHGSRIRPHCIMGTDYYQQNEHWVEADGTETPAGTIYGYSTLAKQYFQRYHLPIMLTETNNLGGVKGTDWLWKEWADMRQLKRSTVPIMGFTWYSLLDQVDWDSSLREDAGRVNPIGLYDLDRKIRDTGIAYKQLIEEWRNEMPFESLALSPGKRISNPQE